jgi:hypothetical protein|tara:strand:+ start:34 stop:204 length:171 start_codon:yes stop_codon:yes gene_type:complete
VKGSRWKYNLFSLEARSTNFPYDKQKHLRNKNHKSYCNHASKPLPEDLNQQGSGIN